MNQPAESQPQVSLAQSSPTVGTFREQGGGLEWSGRQETLRVEPWGPDAVRVRARLGGPILRGLPGALLDEPPATESTVKIGDDEGQLTVGALTVEVNAEGLVRFLRTDDRTEILAEERAHFWWPGSRLYTPVGHGHHRLEQRFAAYDDEKLYGLGQHQHGRLDQKGLVLDLVQRNAEVGIPVLTSSRGYTLLWNNPAIGRVELAGNGTRWVADSARQIDYWITAGAPADAQRRYSAVTGRTPMLPEWAAGFWQCKLRYRTQDELLEVAREYKRRGLPLDAIVCDFFHWTHLGEWKFDPREWPDPAAMVRELDELGVKLVVSVWPSVSPLSENHPVMEQRGYFIGTEYGPMAHADWPDKGVASTVQVAFYDATNPEAREFLWSRIRDNYLTPYGITAFWLDACEPELKPGFQENLRYWAGPGLEVGNIYPAENARTFYEGLRAAGEEEIVSLNRSAWAGSQRYGAALWSGDIGTDFPTLRRQIAAGLNTALSGIPWWNTDIGGFHGGDPDDPRYREVMVRWFQFGALSPLMRLHGFRDPGMALGPDMTGGPNEVWSYGEEAGAVLEKYLRLRERLKPYVLRVMREAHEEGLPPMRPLFLEFPDDRAAWSVDDSYLFGRDLLVAPVLTAGATARTRVPACGGALDRRVDGRDVRGRCGRDGRRPAGPAPAVPAGRCAAACGGVAVADAAGPDGGDRPRRRAGQRQTDARERTSARVCRASRRSSWWTRRAARASSGRQTGPPRSVAVAARASTSAPVTRLISCRTTARSGRVTGAWSGWSVQRRKRPRCTILLASIWSRKIVRISSGSAPSSVARAATASRTCCSRAGSSTGLFVPHFAAATRSAVARRSADSSTTGCRAKTGREARGADTVAVGAPAAGTATAAPVVARATAAVAVAVVSRRRRGVVVRMLSSNPTPPHGQVNCC